MTYQAKFCNKIEPTYYLYRGRRPLDYRKKCQFLGPIFENCAIKKCDFLKATFHTGTFLSCDFLEGDFRIAVFDDIKFIETTFKNSHLKNSVFSSSKVWKSNQSTLIEENSDLENLFEDEDNISNSYQEASN